MLEKIKSSLNYDKNISRLKGFSLAEALITLLIVSIIVAASTYMVAKKNKTNNMRKTGENRWICTRDNEGRYQINAPTGTGRIIGTSCEFTPPPGVSRFDVTVIGGGGGGASGTTVQNSMAITSGSYNYVPLVTGDYYIIVISGGGGGGGCHKKCYRGGLGGGAGGVTMGTNQLTAFTTYVMTVGAGGEAGDKSHSGGEGGVSSFVGGKLNIAPKGGGSGAGAYKRLFDCEWSMNDGGNSGVGGNCSNNAYGCQGNAPREQRNPGVICTSSTNCPGRPGLAEKIGGNAQNVGRGGYGGNNDSGGFVGMNGLVKVIYTPIFGGGGGKTGSQSFYSFKKSPGTTIVTIGNGGAGAVDQETAGAKGGASMFGGRIIADGGSGGRIKATSASAADADPRARGENGALSLAPRNIGSGYSFDAAAGGFPGDGARGGAPGAGGGGGGANMSSFGKGGNGANGAVIIIW